MKILMLLEVNFPPDSRVEKEMISLSQAGHEIFLACVTHNKNNVRIRRTEHYTIYRKYIRKKVFDKFRVTPLIFPYYFKWWRSFAKKIYAETKFDAVHIHDLPLSKVGYYFKKHYGIKFICDQHEFYSDWIRKTAHMNTLPGKIINALSQWGKYENKYLLLADFVITVAEPLRENYMKAYNLSPEKIITIPNTPTSTIFNKENISSDIVDKYREDFVIFYAGVLDVLRGINTAILALPHIREEIPNVKLVLGGRTAKGYDPIQVAKENGVADLVSFIGWIDEKDLPSYFASSKVCFFTPPANRDEINKTIATKIYQYAIMQIPIIVSDAKMMKDFVEENRLGISIKTDNSKEFADAVFKIVANPETYKQGQTKSNWIWEDTVLPLISCYSNLSLESV